MRYNYVNYWYDKVSDNVESKNERFKRVAETRTNKIINMIELLGNCANTNNYEYTEDETKNIFDAIDMALTKSKMQFEDNKKKGNFKL